ncbi:hypothetical protein Tco_0047733 [Tanacetum coccineum]
MASAAAKTYQGDSSEFYLITGSNPDGGRSWFKTSQDSLPHGHTRPTYLKNFKKDENSSFQNQEKYKPVGPKVTSTQDGKRSKDDDSRLCSVDDLKEAQNHMQVKLKGTSSSLKSKDHYTYHKLKDKDSRPRAKTKDIHKMLSLRFSVKGCDLLICTDIIRIT